MRIFKNIREIFKYFRNGGDHSGINNTYYVSHRKESDDDSEQLVTRYEADALLVKVNRKRDWFNLVRSKHMVSRQFVLSGSVNITLDWERCLKEYQKELATELTGSFAVRTNCVELYIERLKTATAIINCKIHLVDAADYSYLRMMSNNETVMWESTK